MPDSHHPGGARPDGAATAESAKTYRFTFGHYTQACEWTDVRHLTWEEVGSLLTNHRIGPKGGTCIVPATFRSAHRQKAEAAEIGVAFLDCDSGATLGQIVAAVERQGWTAVVSSSYSHLNCLTTVNRNNWTKFRSSVSSAGSDGGTCQRL